MKIFLIFAIFICEFHFGLSRPDGNLYEPCDPNSNGNQCVEGLKCSTHLSLCINASCYDGVDACFINCPKVDDCPDENTYKAYSNCGCCSKCETYLELDDDCSHDPEAQKCAPGLECCRNTNTCQELHKRKGKHCKNNCAAEQCVRVDSCPENQHLVEADLSKCRCCAFCQPINDDTE